MFAKMNNQEIETRLKDLVARERKILHVILEHINEVELRRIYLEKAYPSMFEYLVKECHYSGSAAMRRLEAARLLREVPDLSRKIESGAVNLSQIGELSRAIKNKEKLTGERVSSARKTELIKDVAQKTGAQTQQLLAAALDLPLMEFENKRVQKDESVRLEMTFTKEQFEILLKCRDFMANALLNESDSSWSSLYVHLATKAVMKHGFLKSKNDGKPITLITQASTDAVMRINKTLTPKTRRKILHRDQCCQYRDPESGRICASTFGLEVDHRQSRWANGQNTFENLQALCKAHNILKYRKEAGLGYRR